APVVRPVIGGRGKSPVGGVRDVCDDELAEIAAAARSEGALLCLPYERHHQRGEDRHDNDDYEHFKNGEGSAPAASAHGGLIVTFRRRKRRTFAAIVSTSTTRTLRMTPTLAMALALVS